MTVMSLFRIINDDLIFIFKLLISQPVLVSIVHYSSAEFDIKSIDQLHQA